MSTRIAAATAALLFALGVVAQIWAPRLGLTLMLLAVMSAIASTLFMQRAIQRRLMKHERFILKLQQSVAIETGKIQSSISTRASDSVKYDSNMSRPVASLTGSPEASAGPTHASAAKLPSSPAKLGFGRASTPDISNPFANETLSSMLAPRRVLKAAGIFSPEQMPEHEPLLWLPGDVTDSLDREGPDLIVIDEEELRRSAVWSSATTGVGTALMRELLEGLNWAKTHKIPAYLLPTSLSPDVHSSSLRQSSAVQLPLNPDALDAAAGGPQTQLLSRLQELAATRTEGVA